MLICVLRLVYLSAVIGVSGQLIAASERVLWVTQDLAVQHCFFGNAS